MRVSATQRCPQSLRVARRMCSAVAPRVVGPLWRDTRGTVRVPSVCCCAVLLVTCCGVAGVRASCELDGPCGDRHSGCVPSLCLCCDPPDLPIVLAGAGARAEGWLGGYV